MTLKEMRDLARKRLGETTAAFWSDAEINGWINLGCKDIAFRSKCLPDTVTFTPTTDTAEYTLSTVVPDCISITEVYFDDSESDWGKLIPITRTELDIEYIGWKNTDPGKPTHYYWDAEEDLFGFYPAPDSTESTTNAAEVHCCKTAPTLSSDSATSTLPENLHEAVVDFVVATGFSTRGWVDKENDAWQKFFTRIKEYMVERHRQREDESIISRNYRNV